MHPRPLRIKTISTKSTSSLNIMGCSPLDNPDSTSSTSTTSSSTPLGKENGGDYAKPHIFRSPFLPQNDNYTVWKYDAQNNLDNANDTDNHIFDDGKYDPLRNAEETCPPKTVVAMVILNSPIANPPSPIFQTLWNLSSFRICADGGANRLYDATVFLHHQNHHELYDGLNHRDIHETYIPNAICGDLDSLDMSIKEYYKQRGVDIIQDTSQEYNDLDKALSAIRDWKMQKMTLIPEETEPRQGRHDPNQILPCGNKEEDDLQIFVYGAFGGRFDQEMASIQALYRWKDVFQYRIALYTDETFAVLTRPQVTNEIYLPFHSKMEDHVDKGQEIFHGEGPTCGLIPIGCRCDGVKTKGFKWNLDGSVPLEFGGLISTSNRAEDSLLQIESPQPLVFTAEIVLISK